MKKHLKKIISVAMAVIILASLCVAASFSSHASSTGAGLAEWALNAYYSHWSYVYGAATPGTVDCSGLIYTYAGGHRTDFEYCASEMGYVSSGIPRVHGLVLHQPGHYGVYVGDGMAVDARNEYYGVCYESAASKSWVEWIKIPDVTYVSNGWEKFNGSYYYYENGEYVVSTSREIGGVTYNFASNGVSDKTPEDMSAIANSSGSAPKKSTTDTSSSSNDTGSTSSNDTSESTQTTKKSTVLKVGSSGDSVTKLQKRLAELGFYDDEITGYFGDATQAAYMAFQEAAGLIPDGLAGKDERKFLYSSDAPSVSGDTEDNNDEEKEEEREDDGTYRIGDQNEEVVNIQQKLSELNYYSDEFTGYFGAITEQAVINFQFLNGLYATGIVDEDTYNLLFSDAAIAYEVEDESEEETADEQYGENADAEASADAYAEDDCSMSSITDIAEDNLAVAQKVVIKVNRLTKNALSAADDEKTVTVSAEAKNSNFLLWMLILFGFAALVSAAVLVINKRASAYSGAHTKGRKKSDVPVRYW